MSIHLSNILPFKKLRIHVCGIHLDHLPHTVDGLLQVRVMIFVPGNMLNIDEKHVVH